MKNKEQAPKLKKRLKNKRLHAAGIVLGDHPVELLPWDIETNTFLTSPDMKVIEECSLIKYDFLAIGFPKNE